MGSTCHPQTNTQLPQYIVGYGSLIDEQSKRKTDPTAEESFPISVKGYQRRWGVHGNLPGLNATFLSIVENHSASFNGIIYKLSHSDTIEKYDKRERTYCRKQLEADQLQTYSQLNHDDTWLSHPIFTGLSTEIVNKINFFGVDLTINPNHLLNTVWNDRF